MQVQLTPEMESIVNQQIANGYQSPEAVVNASLKLLQKSSQEKIEALRAKLLPALEQSRRGESTPLDIEEIIAEARQQRLENQKKAA